VVRPYALIAGRTKPSGAVIDLVASVSATGDPAPDLGLAPEHLRLLQLCRPRASVAELAASLDLPLGVVRILIADLREHGLVSIGQPKRPGLTDVRVLKEVADALRRL
jgi:DNA-binding transcriptional ArsR family regulator